LKYKGQFVLPAIFEIIPKASAIVFIFVSLVLGQIWIVLGFAIGYALNVLLYYIAARKHGYKKNAIKYKAKEVISGMAKIGLPIFISTYVYQINIFVDRWFATSLQEGVPAALNYANVLFDLPAGVFIAVVLTMYYPKLTKAFAQKIETRVTELIEGGISSICIFMWPMFWVGLLFSNEIVQIVYERDSFDNTATTVTGEIYFALSFGLIALCLMHLINFTYNSQGRTVIPLIAASIGCIVNVALDFLLVRKFEYQGLAFATATSYIVIAVILLAIFLHEHDFIQRRMLAIKAIKLFFLALIPVAIAKGIYTLVMNFATSHEIIMPRMVLFIACALIAIGIYLLLLKLFKFHELKWLKYLKG
jgi:putative peptidoglycan lipid II flippase